MIRIAIVTRQMITGGVEKALLSMLKEVENYDVSVDLYLQSTGGALFSDLPKWVRVCQLQTLKIREVYKHPVWAIKKAIDLLRLWKARSYAEQCQITSNMFLPVKETYDIAIAYHAPNTVPVFYVIDKMNAKRKILWLHGKMENNDGYNPLCLAYHEKFDKTFCVSRDVYNSFIRAHPEKKDAAEIFYNFVDRETIKKLAEKGNDISAPGYQILTIGRLSKEKGIDLAVEAAKLLLERGYVFRWYICGEGRERAALERMISDYHLDSSFVLLGNQDNPYTYLRDCDLYVQPSRSEGYCTTTNEARVLGKPTISTDVSGAREQFADGETGWIVSINAESIAERVAWCMDHPDEVRCVAKNLKTSVLWNKQDIERIWK